MTDASTASRDLWLSRRPNNAADSSIGTCEKAPGDNAVLRSRSLEMQKGWSVSNQFKPTIGDERVVSTNAEGIRNGEVSVADEGATFAGKAHGGIAASNPEWSAIKKRLKPFRVIMNAISDDQRGLRERFGWKRRNSKQRQCATEERATRDVHFHSLHYLGNGGNHGRP